MSDDDGGDMERAFRELADDWQSEAETYLESDVDSERAMAVQQYHDAEKIRRVLDRYVEADAAQERQ